MPPLFGTTASAALAWIFGAWLFGAVTGLLVSGLIMTLLRSLFDLVLLKMFPILAAPTSSGALELAGVLDCSDFGSSASSFCFRGSRHLEVA